MNTSNPTKAIPPSQRRIVSPTEKAEMKRIINENEAMSKENEFTYPAGHADGGGNDAQVRRVKQTLSQGDTDSLTPQEKQRMENRLKEIIPWLKKNMVPKNAMGLRRLDENNQPNEEFNKARNFMAEREMSAEFQQVAQEYKNICRALGRDSSLEVIRPRDGRE